MKKIFLTSILLGFTAFSQTQVAPQGFLNALNALNGKNFIPIKPTKKTSNCLNFYRANFPNDNVQVPNMEETDGDDRIYSASGIEVKPDFPGGMKKFYTFISRNMKIPNDPKSKGKILVSFVVEKDGSLTDVKVVRDVESGMGNEAVGVIKASPKWIPARQNGKTVRCLMHVPIDIPFQNNDKQTPLPEKK